MGIVLILVGFFVGLPIKCGPPVIEEVTRVVSVVKEVPVVTVETQEVDATRLATIEVTREVPVVTEVPVTVVSEITVVATEVVTATVTKEIEVTRLVPVTITPTATPSTPVSPGPLACTRFDLEIGRDRVTGTRGAGEYIMREPSGFVVATWRAQDGWLDSGWQQELTITDDTVYVEVFFRPEGRDLIRMEIVNPAPDTPYGWLTRGICHAIELQFPE